jgi:hypothetical protein
MMKAESVLREDGYQVSFVCCANDGVSCDSKFVHETLGDFPKGKISYSAHTDTNHNVKNSRYQLVVGFNSVSTIGVYMVDAGLLKKAVITQELYRVKDFASDLLVLKLASSATVATIIDLPGQDLQTQVILSISLFFMRVHLCSVNCKGKVNAKQRVSMIWSSFLYLLHVDGVSIITKRNWATETVSLCFVMMRDDIMRPGRSASELSEHTYGSMRGISREFTVNDFIHLVAKAQRFLAAMVDNNLKAVRSSEISGYQATIQTQSESINSRNLPSGPVKIETNATLIEAREGVNDNYNNASLIWKDLRGILNKSSNLTRQFLKKVCKVKEEHPMMKELKETDAPSDLLERLNTLFSASHDDDMRHPGMVPFDVEEIESRAGEREPGENALAARYEDRLVSAIVEANEQQEQPTVPEDVFLNKDVEHIEEHVEDIDGDIIYNAFTNVLAAGWNELLNDPGLIVRSMDEMYLGK